MNNDMRNFSGHGLRISYAGGIAAITDLPGFIGIGTYHLEGITGIYRLQDDSGFYDGQGLALTDFQAEGTDFLRMVFENTVTRLTCEFTYQDGIWSRKDYLKNLQNKEGTIRSCLARFCFSGDHLQLLSQEGAWCTENQSKWRGVENGINITNTGVRTTEGAQPFVCLRDTDQGHGLAFHILPMGQWTIRFRKEFASCQPLVIAEMGLSDQGLALQLQPGEEIALPEILFYSVQPGDNSLASGKIHKYLLKYKNNQKQMPVLYNSWFYDFDRVEIEEFKAQARSAEIGCEYFVVDAGWFGTGAAWSCSVGDWKENTTGAFQGKMTEFADYVRSLGMKMGLWMEPERASVGSELEKTRPELFLYNDGESCLLNMANPDARQYIYDNIERLIKTYGLSFMKLDFNMTVGYDTSGSSFYRYYQGYYGFMERIKKAFPQVYFEACSSGGLRTDINTVCASDSHFLTDTVNPMEMLRIMEGALLRLPPKTLSKWYTVQEVFDISRWYHTPKGQKDRRVLACADATWGRVIEVGEDFLEAFYVTGPLGFSSKLDRMSPEMKEKLKKTVALFKQLRPFVERSVCHMLTAPRLKTDIESDTVWQMKSLDEDRSIIFAYHLEYQQPTVKVFPREIVPEGRYRVSCIGNYCSAEFENGSVFTGTDLLENGIPIHFPRLYGGRMVEITRLD